MRLSTKAVASLTLLTAVAVASAELKRGATAKNSRFDRILQKHDRKGELRASVLGVEPYIFRSMQRKLPFTNIVMQCGFSSIIAFRKALLARLRFELRQRGWSSHKIEHFMMSRASRVQ